MFSSVMLKRHLDRSKKKDSASLPPIETWPNTPILVRKSLSMASSVTSNYSDPIEIHQSIATAIPIENDLFIGNIHLIIAGLNSSPDLYFR